VIGPAPHGTAAALREFIAECMEMARIQAAICVKYAELADDAGLAYALKRHAAYVRAALETLTDLRGDRGP
jgi:hypothetical protein